MSRQIEVEFTRCGVPLGICQSFDLEQAGGVNLEEVIPDEIKASFDGEPYDVILRHDGNEYLFPPGSRRELSFLDSASRATGSRSPLGQRLEVDSVASHEGAGRSGGPPRLALPTPQISISESGARFLEQSCRITDEVHGAVEIAFLAYGLVVCGEILVIRLAIPEQSVTPWYFRIESPDFSRTNREITRRFPKITPVLAIHRHLMLGQPRPSALDRQDEDRMARLLCFNEQVITHREPLRASPRDNGARYRLDHLRREVSIIAETGPAGDESPSELSLVWEEKIPVSYVGFLILPENGDLQHSYGEAVRVLKNRLGETPGPELKVIEDIGVKVITDQEAADRAGVSLDSIQPSIDDEELARLIAERLVRRQSQLLAGTGWSQSRSSATASTLRNAWPDPRPRFLAATAGSAEVSQLLLEIALAMRPQRLGDEPSCRRPDLASLADLRDAAWEAASRLESLCASSPEA